ncbi:restriction endonuclease subunit S [Streptomyces sp. NPDC058619]|uniref:restriction endonuclease subunit S n=1 Tax=unclassified Streptomyces TaxID=2593676 RepID=UPI003654C0A2
MLGLGCLTQHGFQPLQLKNAPSSSFAEHVAVLRDGDLLVSRANTRNLVGLAGIYRDVGVPCVYPDLMMRLRTSERCLPEFLEIVLRAPGTRRRIAALAQGTSESMVKISSAMIKELAIPVCPLAEQRRVVAVLDAASVQEREIRAEISKMRMVRSGLLDRAFRDGEPWPLRSIGDLCHVSSGSTPSRAAGSRYFAKAGTPWVKTLDLNEGSILVTDESLTDVAMSELRLRRFPVQSVLVAMYGGWEQIGRTAILGVPAAVNQAVSVLEARRDLNPEYLLLALQHGRHGWRRFAASTRKDPNITKSDVLGFKIPVPPCEEQERLVRLAAAPLREIAVDEEQLGKLWKLKQGLVGGLLAGDEVRAGELSK